MIYLGLGTLFIAIANLIQILPFFQFNLSLKVIYNWILVSVLLFALAFSLLIIFFDYFSGMKNYFWITFSVSFSLVTFYLILSALLTGFYEIIFFEVVIENFILYGWSNITSFILLPMFIGFAYASYSILRDSEKNAININQLKQIKIMKTGFILLAVVSAILGTIGAVFLFNFNNKILFAITVFVLQRFTISIGLIYIVYGYISVKQVAFLQPQRIETLLVIDQSGIPLFRYDFKGENIKSDTGLVSGAITAIGALMQEALGVTTNVRSIQFFDKELDLHFLDKMAFVLIVSKSTKFTQQSLERFAKSFQITHREFLEEPALYLNEFSKSEPLLLSAFGY